MTSMKISEIRPYRSAHGMHFEALFSINRKDGNPHLDRRLPRLIESCCVYFKHDQSIIMTDVLLRPNSGSVEFFQPNSYGMSVLHSDHGYSQELARKKDTGTIFHAIARWNKNNTIVMVLL